MKIQGNMSSALSSDLSNTTYPLSGSVRKPLLIVTAISKILIKNGVISHSSYICAIKNHNFSYSQYHNCTVKVFIFLSLYILFLCRINNCVGEDNHWLFLQLCFYTQILSSYTLILDFCHYYYFLPLKKASWVRICFLYKMSK